MICDGKITKYNFVFVKHVLRGNDRICTRERTSLHRFSPREIIRRWGKNVKTIRCQARKNVAIFSSHTFLSEPQTHKTH